MSRTITKWGKECKKQMIDKGVTLTDISNITGYSRTYISAIINNRVSVPDSTFQIISKAMGVNPDVSLSGQGVH